MEMTSSEIWLTIFLVGIATFAVRFSFIGIIGDRELPEWILRHLRYTPVAVLPGLVAPLVLWPAATQGQTDPARLAAACMAFVVGYFSKSFIWSAAAGIGTLFLMLWLLG
ncbi:AzlD domain-containing protein [Halocynthiibacter namhaensis]|uniref:AzlD domain-containing protein n=1 Tax=Halocynthiibacter namhaensis TaxID=1290553 RepID=UPI0005795CF7|nr:AzlD domain-containing protein [Halocynthiibacter namhaensis]